MYLAFLHPLIPKQNGSVKGAGDEALATRTQAKRNNSAYNINGLTPSGYERKIISSTTRMREEINLS